MTTTTYTPRHRADTPDRLRLTRRQADVLAVIYAAGQTGIPMANIRTRCGLEAGRAWAVFTSLRAMGLVWLDYEGHIPVAHIS